MATSTDSPPPLSWWERYDIPDGRAGRWQIGPLKLTVHRQAPEWRLVYEHDSERQDGNVAIECPIDADLAADTGEILRVMSSDESGFLRLQPAPADRDVVVRPETAILVLPDARIRLFVSIPVWLRVELGESPQPALDVPTWRLSDTWFGPSTRHGELCYAVRTSARLHLANLPVLGHRAITQVLLENRTQERISLERLSLPVPNLALYADAASHLWTQTVTVRFEGADRLAEIDLGKGPPDSAPDPRPVAEPRAPLPRNIFRRAIGALLQ